MWISLEILGESHLLTPNSFGSSLSNQADPAALTAAISLCFSALASSGYLPIGQLLISQHIGASPLRRQKSCIKDRLRLIQPFRNFIFPNHARRILPWAFSGFALDGLDSRSIQTSSDRPGPSLHITAAATSRTSFTNVSGQPKSRKREQKLFPAKSYMPLQYNFWPVSLLFALG
jgi:hypothetical protein